MPSRSQLGKSSGRALPRRRARIARRRSRARNARKMALLLHLHNDDKLSLARGRMGEMTRDRVPLLRIAVTAGVVILLAGAAVGIYALARHREPPKPVLGTDTTGGALALATQTVGEGASSPVVAVPAPPGQSVQGYAAATGYAQGAPAAAQGNASAAALYAPGTSATSPGAVYPYGRGSYGYAPATTGAPAPAAQAPALNGGMAPAPGAAVSGAVNAPVRSPATVRPGRATTPTSRPGQQASDTALPADAQAAPPGQASPASPQPSPAPRPDTQPRPKPDSLPAPAAKPADTAPKPAAPPPPKPDTASRPAPDTSRAPR